MWKELKFPSNDKWIKNKQKKNMNYSPTESSTENKLMVTNESGIEKMGEKNERALVQIALVKIVLGK